MPEGYYARWDLPDPVDPPDTICFQINVPNERHHLGAFYGAIYALSYSKNWQRDNDHTAALAARVWSKIFDQLIAGNCAVPARLLQGIVQEDFMPLRVDCDCNVFVTCCDGTEQQILTSDQVRALIGGQPGGGSPQPQPGGGCVTYHGTMGAREAWYVPTLVSDGDTIQLSSLEGAWNDGDLSRWYCGDGERFVGGACIGLQATDPGDPLPTAPHMSIVALVGSTYYDLSSGMVTIGGGVENQQLTLAPNDSDLTNNSGSITFDVEVCNNQGAPWSHLLDLTIDVDGWQILDIGGAPAGQWTPGTGFEAVNGDFSGHGPNTTTELKMGTINFGEFRLLSFQIFYDSTTGSFGAGVPYFNVNYLDSGHGENNLISIAPGTGSALVASFTGDQDCFGFVIDTVTSEVTSGAADGATRIYRMSVTGIGFDPFV